MNISQLRLLQNSMTTPRESLNFHSADWLGFDLDLTFVRYRLDTLSKLVFDCMGNYLIEHKKYSPELLSRGYLPHFPARGLIYDLKLGNFVLLTASGKVMKAFHGTRKLSDSEAEAAYPGGLPGVAKELQKHPKAPGFHVFATFFDMPYSILVAHFVDIEDAAATSDAAPSYARILRDSEGAMNHCFNPANFATNTGGYFSMLKANPGDYIHKISPRMRAWLQQLRASGTRLFLLTNSQADYSNLLLSFSCGEDWRDLFDLVIVNGTKPAFFLAAEPFRAVAGMAIGDPAPLALGGLFAGGNHHDLDVFMRAHTTRERPADSKVCRHTL
jgi:HAD superfamily 5'-nucleotidase-like hydrolase